MRFDDPARPSEKHLGETLALHTSGSALPTITLVRPLQTEKSIGTRCTAGEHCNSRKRGDEETVVYHKGQIFGGAASCASCEQACEPCWGWLACIHAHRGANRFGYHTAIIPDLARFHEEWMSDPEATLVKYFKYAGPEETTKPTKASLPDLWSDE